MKTNIQFGRTKKAMKGGGILVLLLVAGLLLNMSGCTVNKKIVEDNRRKMAVAKAQNKARNKNCTGNNIGPVGLGVMVGGSSAGGEIGLLALTIGGTSASSGRELKASSQASETSGCKKVIRADLKNPIIIGMFLETNHDALEVDLARGGGQHLQSLATLLGCSPSDYGKLTVMAQQNYGELFPSMETDPTAFLARLKGKMTAHPSLNCGRA